MIIEEEKIIKDGSEIILRCPRAEDTETVLEVYKKISGETPYLVCDPDELRMTAEQEKEFLEAHNSSPSSLMILAFVDGRYAGNCSFEGRTRTRRTAHRAVCGIALLQEFTGKGLGKIMLSKLLTEAKKAGFGQIELDVYSENIRARRLYEKLGFIECGAIPDASRVGGKSMRLINMYKKL